MGGSALLIYGRISEDLLQPRAVPRSIVDRMLGRVRTKAPAWSPIGRDRRLIDLPTNGLRKLVSAFRDRVAAQFDPPWSSTRSVLDYLRLDVIYLHVRGDASSGDPPDWYIQLTFSGAAGMAEVSAQLASHWAERWYRAESDDLLASYLEPYGFEPDGRIEPDSSTDIFVPLGAAGYALFNAAPRAPDDEAYFESRYFEIDVSAIETLSEAERARVLQTLDEELPRLFPPDTCCCQWCAPNFDVASVDRLVPFR
jgi:hypothetical protein